MITTESLEQEKALAEAIPKNKILSPNMPVKEYLQEAADLISICEKDREKLDEINFDWSKYERLEPAVEVTRDAQTIWMEERRDIEDAMEEWQIKYPDACALKKELLETMRFVYDGDEQALARVSEITAGNSREDTIQDLHDIAYKAHLDLNPFQKINYDVSLFGKAESYSSELMLLLSKINGNNGDNNGYRVFRDQAYTNLKKIVDYIRKQGRYALRHDQERAEAYSSNYHKH
jgi:hypothetical protein